MDLSLLMFELNTVKANIDEILGEIDNVFRLQEEQKSAHPESFLGIQLPSLIKQDKDEIQDMLAKLKKHISSL